MKKEKIKSLPVVKAFTDYIVRRGKRALKLKNADFDSIHIDLFDDSICVWFHSESRKGIVGKVNFTLNGKQVDKLDNREKESGRK